jgi:hypothetical protein
MCKYYADLIPFYHHFDDIGSSGQITSINLKKKT